jgi:hypothetical protein
VLAKVNAGQPTTAPLPAMVELDRLEAALAGTDHADLDHQAVTTRLRALLSRLTAPAEPPEVPDLGRIESASADELFDLIDSELGDVAR